MECFRNGIRRFRKPLTFKTKWYRDLANRRLLLASFRLADPRLNWAFSLVSEADADGGSANNLSEPRRGSRSRSRRS